MAELNGVVVQAGWADVLISMEGVRRSILHRCQLEARDQTACLEQEAAQSQAAGALIRKSAQAPANLSHRPIKPSHQQVSGRQGAVNPLPAHTLATQKGQPSPWGPKKANWAHGDSSEAFPPSPATPKSQPNQRDPRQRPSRSPTTQKAQLGPWVPKRPAGLAGFQQRPSCHPLPPQKALIQKGNTCQIYLAFGSMEHSGAFASSHPKSQLCPVPHLEI
uniref:Uncharacterized protein n=1 Tax=Sphaerodactylus townsendi TaxID=933632 RepID=A0ACB8G495_9SAUR